MRSRARFSDHTESKLIRSLERRLSRCQCCCAADLWVVSDTKLIRLQISLGFERRMLLDVTNNWFSLKASTGLFANREENSYFYFNPARYAQKGRAMNENESPDRDRLDCRTTKCEISDVKLLLKQGQLEWNAATSLTTVCRTVISLVALYRMNSSGALFQSEKLCCTQLCHLHGVGVAEITSALLFHKHAHSWQQFHEAILHLSAT